nr:rhodanese-like domain-containing protein [Lederbergia citrea]
MPSCFVIIEIVKSVEGVTRVEEIKTITPEEVKNQLREGKNLHLIDVREDDEVAEGMIPKAVHIPMGEIPDQLDQLNRDNEYILVCRSGGRSGRVCEYLMEQGLNVKNMVGGMLEWTGPQEPKR